MAMLDKLDTALDTVIAVDSQNDTVSFYTFADDARDSFQYKSFSCKAKVFNNEFFSNLSRILKDFRAAFPQISMQKVALILPDHLFFLDTIKVPLIHRKAMQNSLRLATETLYKNRAELEINSDILQQNRKQVTYAISGMRRDLMNHLKRICNENNVGLQSITFAANATVNAASVLNPKMKGATSLLLDIKEKYTRFAFMVRGKTMGYYSLPFGYSLLEKKRVATEDLLFDHSSGELLVLNAKERARSKQLTLAEEIATFEDLDEDSLFGDVGNAEGNESDESDTPIAGSTRKPSRKLPKFMLRPIPESREACAYENFRLFVKWALELIASNSEITSYGTITSAYVNMPKEYAYLFDIVNTETDEHKIVFAPLLTGDNNSKEIARYLEIYGGFYISQNAKNGTF